MLSAMFNCRHSQRLLRALCKLLYHLNHDTASHNGVMEWLTAHSLALPHHHEVLLASSASRSELCQVLVMSSHTYRHVYCSRYNRTYTHIHIYAYTRLTVCKTQRQSKLYPTHARIHTLSQIVSGSIHHTHKQVSFAGMSCFCSLSNPFSYSLPVLTTLFESTP